MIKHMFLIFLGAWIVLATLAAVARACAVCLTGFGEDSVAEAFNWSVLFLMATPYLVVGSILGWLLYKYRRTTARRAQKEHAQPSVDLAWNPKESER